MKSPARIVCIVMLLVVAASCSAHQGSQSPTSAESLINGTPISSIGGLATPSVSIASLQPDQCPKDVEPWLRRNDVPGAGHELVPGSPSSLIACIRGRRVVITDPGRVAAIADALNALKLIQKGAVFNCALFTEPIGALFFTYPDGDLLAVELGGPCNTVSNGTRMAFLGHAAKPIRHLALSG